MTVDEYIDSANESQPRVMTPGERTAAIQQSISQIDTIIEQFGNARAALVDGLDEPMPIPQAYQIANNLFLAVVEARGIDIASLAWALADGYDFLERTEIEIWFAKLGNKLGQNND